MFSIEAIREIQITWYNRRSDAHGLVYDTRKFGASDPRDKIYALVGLLNDFAHRGEFDVAIPGSFYDHQRDDDEHKRTGPKDEVDTLTAAKGVIDLFAEHKYKSGQAPKIVCLSEDPGVVVLAADLENLLIVLLNFTSNLQHRFLNLKTNDSDGNIANAIVTESEENCSTETDFQVFRTKIDHLLMKLRSQLDDRCNVDDNSDILCVDRWVSEVAEDLKHRVNNIGIISFKKGPWPPMVRLQDLRLRPRGS